MTVITRFAPSPTGFLHIGGARTAIFSWLFARHHGGKSLLRIEDTDRERSTPEAIEAIFDSLKWLGLDHDGDVVYQFSRRERHQEVAQQLLADGKAYEDTDPEKGTAVRLKGNKTGQTIVQDVIQGDVVFENEQMDDMVLLRSDGTPTYMLSVVVDDYDMGVTHVIRGDDHLTNAFRQSQLYQAMGWGIPKFAHVPLIHGADGAKLSKRHGAVGTEAYKAMGILPEAMFNYLLRLGWSHGDEETINRDDAIKWFDLDHVGKSPSRLDMDKLHHVNAHYIKESCNKELLASLHPFFEEKMGTLPGQAVLDLYLAAMDELKDRAKTLPDIVDAGLFFTKDMPVPADEKAASVLTTAEKPLLEAIQAAFTGLPDWNADDIFAAIKATAETQEMKMGHAAQRARAAVTGYTSGISLGKVLEILGKDDVLRRLGYTLQNLT